MKKNTISQTIMFQATIIIAILITTACNTEQPKPDDSAEVAATENDAKFDNKKLEKDAQFLVDATAMNLDQIQLGKLAQLRGSSADVKELAKMMVTEHTKSLEEVRDLAKTKTVSIPDSATAEAQSDYNSLNSKSGTDFDKAYCNLLVKGHKDAIEKFEKESSDSRDSEIKDWSTTKLPDLRKHLDHIFDCQKKCEKM